jgi:L-ascorbate oxidase
MSRHTNRTRTAAAASIALFGLLPALATQPQAEVLKDPPVLRSIGGVLDVLIIAKQNENPILGLASPVGWIYDICYNPGPGISSCPQTPTRSQAYGGTRLALKAGDKLKMRLVNKLPAFAPGEAKHASEPGRGDIALNPTNIHTHGLIVEARRPTAARPTWGDNVFVLAYNTANGVPQPNLTGSHSHGAVMSDSIQYDIDIPANHPSGQFWFHPHAHGVALNQVSAGLAGIISIGDSAHYACEDWNCATPWAEANVRHLILKDTQVDGVAALPKMLTQESPQFCLNPDDTMDPPLKGYCLGKYYDATDPTTDHAGGKWLFSVNGQVYPKIPVANSNGEIWRITNASASNAYDLHLYDDALAKDMVMQVISVDGVSVSATDVITTGQSSQIAGNKLKLANCQNAPVPNPIAVAPPVCVSGIKMYPSSRVEVWVHYRGADDKLAVPPKGARATFKSVGLQTGAAGDTWPAVDLADVAFVHGARPAGYPEFVRLKGHAATAHAAGGIFATAASGTLVATAPLAAGNPCKPLPPGHKRRIYYGVPTGVADGFGLAYEEIDALGNPVNPSASPTTVVQYDAAATVICLPLAKGNVPVKETWELVNLAGEDHNFHIHQTKFRVVGAGKAPIRGARAGLLPVSLNPPTLPFPKGTVLHDNIPLLAGTPVDATGCAGIDEWKAGSCQPTTLTVEIAFSQVGDFVYHCHILEHEDGGMMARIAVMPNP